MSLAVLTDSTTAQASPALTWRPRAGGSTKSKNVPAHFPRLRGRARHGGGVAADAHPFVRFQVFQVGWNVVHKLCGKITRITRILKSKFTVNCGSLHRESGCFVNRCNDSRFNAVTETASAILAHSQAGSPAPPAA